MQMIAYTSTDLESALSTVCEQVVDDDNLLAWKPIFEDLLVQVMHLVQPLSKEVMCIFLEP